MLALSALAGVLASGCGEDEVIMPDPVPTAEETRAFFGLTDGSCIRYRFAQQGTDLFATSVITGPDQSSVAGRSVYRRPFRLPAGGLADEQFIEAQDDGELRLVRFDTSLESGGDTVRQSKRYPDGSEPVLLRLTYDELGVPAVELGGRFEQTTTPEQTQGMAVAEQHTVIVQAVDELVSNVPYEGTAEAVELLYRRAIGTEQPRTTQYTLVPGSGIVEIIEGGTTYVACDWRVCDTSGSCSGAASCDQLSCN